MHYIKLERSGNGWDLTKIPSESVFVAYEPSYIDGLWVMLDDGIPVPLVEYDDPKPINDLKVYNEEKFGVIVMDSGDLLSMAARIHKYLGEISERWPSDMPREGIVEVDRETLRHLPYGVLFKDSEWQFLFVEPPDLKFSCAEPLVPDAWVSWFEEEDWSSDCTEASTWDFDINIDIEDGEKVKVICPETMQKLMDTLMRAFGEGK